LICSGVKGGGARRGQLMKTRLLYIFIRSLDLCYFGIVTLSCAQLAAASSLGTADIAAAAVILAIFGIILPLILYFRVVSIPLSDLLKDDDYKYAWMAFYGLMKPRCRKYIILPWIKRLLIGIAFGAFTQISLIAQVSIAVFVCIVYNIGIFLIDPYADYLHHYMDLITTGLTALSFLPLYGYAANIFNNSVAITTVTALFLIFQLLSFVVCVGMFVYSWMQLRGVYQLGQLKNCCS